MLLGMTVHCVYLAEISTGHIFEACGIVDTFESDNVERVKTIDISNVPVILGCLGLIYLS